MDSQDAREKAEVKRLKIEIEQAMARLDNLQAQHRHLTGINHRMPIYLAVPAHLAELVNEATFQRNLKN